MGYLEELQLEQAIQGMENLERELGKLEERLQKQYEKLDEVTVSKKVLFYVPIKVMGGKTEEIPIYGKNDLQELWEADYISSSRLLEKYESKLDGLLKTENKREQRSLISNTLKALDRCRKELSYDVAEEKNKLKSMKEMKG